MRSRWTRRLLSPNVYKLSARAPLHLATEASPRTSPIPDRTYHVWLRVVFFLRRLRV